MSKNTRKFLAAFFYGIAFSMFVFAIIMPTMKAAGVMLGFVALFIIIGMMFDTAFSVSTKVRITK